MIRLLLLDTVDILASHNISNRPLARKVLGHLLEMSQCVDREIFFFEYSQTTAEEWKVDSVKVEDRQNWVFRQVAGWRCSVNSNICTFDGDLSMGCYLDVPLKVSRLIRTTYVYTL